MIVVLAGAIVLASLGQLAMKMGINGVGSISPTDLLSLDVLSRLFLSLASVGFVLYLGSAALYVVALSKSELTRVYPLVSLTYLITLVLGFFLLGEHLSIQRIIGVIMVVCGCYFVISS